uniref:C-7 ketoreductase n=2 Tax=Streptomyces nogalater TaxID=38314 RepID=Q9RN66_STRNO|nr:C-7 ketoreductase [Streptomyces nogalater]WBU77278.1 SnoaF [Cosmid vector pSnogaori_NGS]
MRAMTDSTGPRPVPAMSPAPSPTPSPGPAPGSEPAPLAVIVTGGGSGIGRATARAFAAQGAKVLVVGRTEDALAQTAEGCADMRVLVADVASPDGPQAVVNAALREFGRIDVLVNNAAVAGMETLQTVDRDAVARQFGTNLTAPLFLVQSALGALEKSRGIVVNVGTAATLGLRAAPTGALYGASKVALDYLTRTWAVELAPRGIRVVGVAPGVIDTGIGVRMGMTPEGYREFLTGMGGRVPVGRVGRPEDVAWWIVQLARPEAGYATGMVVPVDGGLSLV